MGNGWAPFAFSSGRALVISFSSTQSLFFHKTDSNTVSLKPLYRSNLLGVGLVFFPFLFFFFLLGFPMSTKAPGGRGKGEEKLTGRQFLSFRKEHSYFA